MNYVKIDFSLQNAEDADILAALFASEPHCGSEEQDGHFILYYNETNFHESEIRDLLQPFQFSYSLQIIPHENWNASWESNFEPIQVNTEVGVRADFHPPFENCRYDLIITPKMSFGTGHHATTKMMLEYLSESTVAGKSVLDFGCGTGVLAILAALKDASFVAGIDHDQWSVENAQENCLRNHCPQIEISDRDLFSFDQKFDLILANINLNVLLETLPRLREILSEKGDLYLSGILETDIPILSECFNSLGFRFVSKKQEHEWVALHIN